MRILIAEDDTVTRRLIQGLLVKWGYELVVATNGDEAWNVLQREDSPRLAILDWMMPGIDGVTVCKSVRSLRVEPYTYVILLTGKDKKEDIVSGLEAGADDYLTKPFDTYELKARLRTGARILNLQNELILARDALKEQATHDPLTGLWNRGAALEILKNEIRRGDREGTPLTVAIADIDHFKQVNDTYGHLVGDDVLREIAQRIQSSLRDYDCVGRYGGEEFLFVFPGCKSSSGYSQAERLREAVSSTPLNIEGTLISVTLSLGLVTWQQESKVNVQQLLASADVALYQAKARGRNRVEMAGTLPGMASPKLPGVAEVGDT